MTPIDDALQAALAVEHQVVFGYGLLGPRLAAAERPLAQASQSAHEQLRNRTITVLSAAGLTPVAAEVDYPALYPVADPAAAVRLAIRLETSAATAWRFLYSQSSEAGASPALRPLAQAALTECAVRATRWRVAAHDPTPTVPFPGI